MDKVYGLRSESSSFSLFLVNFGRRTKTNSRQLENLCVDVKLSLFLLLFFIIVLFVWNLAFAISCWIYLCVVV